MVFFHDSKPIVLPDECDNLTFRSQSHPLVLGYLSVDIRSNATELRVSLEGLNGLGTQTRFL